MISTIGVMLGLLAWPGFIAEIQPWWNASATGWVGSVGGSVIGGCGAVVGILASLGKGRRLVLALMVALIVVGTAASVAGVVALLSDQPYGVWYPLLLGGCLVAGISVGTYPSARRRYSEFELRKIQAADT